MIVKEIYYFLDNLENLVIVIFKYYNGIICFYL